MQMKRFSLAVAVLNWQYVNKHPCPVMIEDMGRTSDGTEIKSMYPLCNCNVPHVRKIREISSSDSSSEVTKSKALEDEFSDFSSGEIPESPSIIDSFEPAEMKISVPEHELSDDYLIPFEKTEPKSNKNKREKKPIAAELRLKDDLNETVSNKIHIMSSPEALIQEPSAGFHNRFNHDLESNKVPIHLIEESVIDPPILLPDGSDSDNVLKYPEYEQVDKHYVPETTTTSNSVNADFDILTSESTSNMPLITDSLLSTTSDSKESTTMTHSTNSDLVTTNQIFNELSPVSTYSTEMAITTVTEGKTNISEEAEVITDPGPTASVEAGASYITAASDDLDFGKSVHENMPQCFGSSASSNLRTVFLSLFCFQLTFFKANQLLINYSLIKCCSLIKYSFLGFVY